MRMHPGRTVFSIFLVLLLAACASAPPATPPPEPSPTLATGGSCTGAEVQRVLTYCASPSAAELARRHALMRDELSRGPLSRELLPVPTEGSPALGVGEAPVTVVLFADLQCPYSAMALETLDGLRERYGEELRVVYRHAPLPFHDRSVPAALAAIAAGEQGRFWEFVRLAFGNKGQLSDDDFVHFALALELDTERFRERFGTEEHVAALRNDVELAVALGVRGTPTMFINGLRVVGAIEAEVFVEIIDRQRQMAAALVESGVPSNEIYWRLVAEQYVPIPVEQLEGEEPVPSDESDGEGEDDYVVEYVPVEQAPARGAAAADALVTIVTFADFKCGHCAYSRDVLARVLARYGDRVRVVHRHFPLRINEQAGPAAAAAIVAAERGKFWQMYDLLYDNQRDLSAEALGRYAARVGIDAATLQARMNDEAVRARLAHDITLGERLGVNGTPTHFINGIRIPGSLSFDDFEQILEYQLTMAERVQQMTGSTGDELYRALVELNRR